MTWINEVEEIKSRMALARQMGGAERVERHRAAGRLTVRERIDRLLDSGTFHETGALAGKAVYDGDRLVSFTPSNFVMGRGAVEGRTIVVGGVGPRTLALVREHADWWNLPIQSLEVLDERRAQAGDASVSVQQMVALVPGEDERAAVTEMVAKRFGRTVMGDTMVVGTPDELVAHFAALQERGIDRVYTWFADFAPVPTLERFADVIGASS